MRISGSNPRWALVGALGVALMASFAAGAGDAPPEPDSYRQSDYRAPTPATLKGARVLTTAEAAAMWRAWRSRVHRRLAATAASCRLASGRRLAGQAAVRHPGQPVAARYGLRRTRSGHARLLSARAGQGLGRPLASSRVLLPEGLLDVLERGQARDGAWLLQCRLVSRRRRWLGCGRPASREARSRTPAVTGAVAVTPQRHPIWH